MEATIKRIVGVYIKKIDFKKFKASSKYRLRLRIGHRHSKSEIFSFFDGLVAHPFDWIYFSVNAHQEIFNFLIFDLEEINFLRSATTVAIAHIPLSQITSTYETTLPLFHSSQAAISHSPLFMLLNQKEFTSIGCIEISFSLNNPSFSISVEGGSINRRSLKSLSLLRLQISTDSIDSNPISPVSADSADSLIFSDLSSSLTNLISLKSSSLSTWRLLKMGIKNILNGSEISPSNWISKVNFFRKFYSTLEKEGLVDEPVATLECVPLLSVIWKYCVAAHGY